MSNSYQLFKNGEPSHQVWGPLQLARLTLDPELLTSSWLVFSVMKNISYNINVPSRAHTWLCLTATSFGCCKRYSSLRNKFTHTHLQDMPNLQWQDVPVGDVPVLDVWLVDIPARKGSLRRCSCLTSLVASARMFLDLTRNVLLRIHDLLSLESLLLRNIQSLTPGTLKLTTWWSQEHSRAIPLTKSPFLQGCCLVSNVPLPQSFLPWILEISLLESRNVPSRDHYPPTFRDMAWTRILPWHDIWNITILSPLIPLMTNPREFYLRVPDNTWNISNPWIQLNPEKCDWNIS